MNWTGAQLFGSAMATVPQGHGALVCPDWLSGDGIFETIHVQDGHVFQEQLHKQRFVESAKILELDIDLEQFDAACQWASKTTGEGRHALRIQVMRQDCPAAPSKQLFAMHQSAPLPPKSISLATWSQSIDANDLRRLTKCADYSLQETALQFAAEVGADDALLCNQNGEVAETTSGNIFAIIDGLVYAPGAQSGALPGTTRRFVLALIGDYHERLPLKKLREASEVFRTSAIAGVCPVTMIDEKPVGKGTPGPIARRLQKQLQAARAGSK